MFTIRFNRSYGDGYTSYSCRSYEVVAGKEDDTALVMTFPDGEVFTERLGSAHEFGVAYVTNNDSRTIDVIRATDAS